MTRILADLPDDDIKWLDAARGRAGQVARVGAARGGAGLSGRSALTTGWMTGFGLWATRTALRSIRSNMSGSGALEWTRPWDDDYEEVRAELPDLFDEEDDRQRRIYLDMLAGK